MSLLLLLRGAIAHSAKPGDTNPTPPDLVTSGRYIGVQIGQRSNKPLILPYQGVCDQLAVGDIRASVQTGGKSGAPLLGFSRLKCGDASGNLISGENYLGVQIGGYGGKPLVYTNCKRCGDDTDPLPNPRYPSFCYGCSALELPSVLCGTHTGSASHDGSFYLKRWNGGASNPVPWLPAWFSDTYTYPGWYSDLINDIVCNYHYTRDIPGRHFDYTWTDRYYYFYWYNLGTAPAEQCNVAIVQFYTRTGTLVITGDSPGTFNLGFEHSFPSGITGTVCGSSFTCDPLTVRAYLGTPFSILPVVCNCPDYAASIALGLMDPAYDCTETPATCTPGTPYVGSGQYIEISLCESPPPWEPP